MGALWRAIIAGDMAPSYRLTRASAAKRTGIKQAYSEIKRRPDQHRKLVERAVMRHGEHALQWNQRRDRAWRV